MLAISLNLNDHVALLAASQHDTFFPIVQIKGVSTKSRVISATEIADLIIFMKLFAVFCAIAIELSNSLVEIGHGFWHFFGDDLNFTLHVFTSVGNTISYNLHHLLFTVSSFGCSNLQVCIAKSCFNLLHLGWSEPF